MCDIKYTLGLHGIKRVLVITEEIREHEDTAIETTLSETQREKKI